MNISNTFQGKESYEPQKGQSELEMKFDCYIIHRNLCVAYISAQRKVKIIKFNRCCDVYECTSTSRVINVRDKSDK